MAPAGEPMRVEIRGERVLLRDPLAEDFGARSRWHTVEIAWQDWDAPWEGKSVSPPDSPEQHGAARRRFLEEFARPLPTPRGQLWIQAISGPLLGWTNCYHYHREARVIWAGIDLCESDYWGRGLGTEAFRLWIGYLFTHYEVDRVGAATWSGNVRMVRVAEKCGLVLVSRNVRSREVRGEWYDGLGFMLAREDWDGWTGEAR